MPKTPFQITYYENSWAWVIRIENLRVQNWIMPSSFQWKKHGFRDAVLLLNLNWLVLPIDSFRHPKQAEKSRKDFEKWISYQIRSFLDRNWWSWGIKFDDWEVHYCKRHADRECRATDWRQEKIPYNAQKTVQHHNWSEH